MILLKCKIVNDDKDYMSGLIKKQNFINVIKSFGVVIALKLIVSNDKTFLDFLIRNNIF